jgi:hypothetical protein
MKKPFAKQIIVGSMALALLGGAGALALTQNAFAATDAAATAAATAKTTKGDHSFHEIRAVSDQLIAFLKLDKATFETKLATQTLAQIATDQGISREALKAELTKEVNAQMDQDKADFATNLDATIDSKQLGDFGGREGRGGHGGHGGKGFHNEARIDLTATATLLGYATVADLQTALVSGTSIADLATAKGIKVQSVIDLQVKQIVKDLDAKLAAKTITQTQYDKMKANSTNKATNFVNDKHDRKFGRGHDNDAVVAPTTAPTSTSTATPSAT